MCGTAVLLVGLCVTGFGIAASGAGAAPGACTAPGGSGLQKNINTSLGCDNTSGQAGFPITGYIADSGLSPGQVVTFEDGYQGLSSHLFYYGTYSLTLDCTAGSPASQTATYVVEQGTGSYPSPPPTVTSGSLPQVTADGSGDIVCAYSLTVGNAPGGHLNSSRNDLWTLGTGGQHTATQSVKPPTLTTTTTTTTSTTSTTVAPTTTTSTTVAPTTTTSTTSTTSTTVAPTTTTSTTSTTVAPTTTTSTTSTTVAPTTTTISPSSSTAALATTTTTTTTIAPTTTSPPTSTGQAPQQTTSTTKPSSGALAFTGSNANLIAAIGLVVAAVGVLLLQLSNRRRPLIPTLRESIGFWFGRR